MTAFVHDTDWAEWLPLYALDALEGEERRRVADHLAGPCPTCRAELAALTRDLELIAESVPPLEPSPLTRRRLLDRLEPTTPEQPPAARRSWAGLAWAAGLAAVLLGGALLRQNLETDRLRGERDRLVAELEQSRGEVDELRAETRTLAAELGTLTARQARQIVLAGLEDAPQASALAYVDPGAGQARFYAFDLPELPADRDYQLWVIAGGVPVSAGVFAVDEGGAARVEVASLPELAEIEAWAVTIEPTGGVPQPTGAMVLLST